jgi:hypothetical protein
MHIIAAHDRKIQSSFCGAWSVAFAELDEGAFIKEVIH